MLNKPWATYLVTFANISYEIKLSKVLNKEIKKIYDNHVPKKAFDKEDYFPFYEDFFKTSADYSKLDSNPYLSQTLKNKIKKEIKQKVEKKVLKSLKQELKTPKHDYYINIQYDKNGLSFQQIKEKVYNGETKDFKCKDKNVYIMNPKIEFNAIEECFENYTVYWAFKYPVGIVKFMSWDKKDSVDFINKYVTKKFKTLKEFEIINFYIYKGEFSQKIEQMKKQFKRVTFLKNLKYHSPEHLLIVDIRGLKNKQKYLDNIYNHLME